MPCVPKAAFVGVLLFCLCLGHRTAQRAQVLTRCLCLKFQEKVDPKFIVDFQIIEKGAHCHRDEIILTVRLPGGQIEMCLDSSKKQGKNLLSCWTSNLNDPRKQRHCMRKRQRPKTRAKQ